VRVPSIPEAAKQLDFKTRDGQRDAAVASLAKVSALCLAAMHGWDFQHDWTPAGSTALKLILPGSTKLTGIAYLGYGRLAPVLSVPEIVKCLV
jgi:hypothetical protein